MVTFSKPVFASLSSVSPLVFGYKNGELLFAPYLPLDILAHISYYSIHT
jgi:hypothetical protein